MSDTSEIRLIQMNQYVRPEIKEVSNKDYVLNGRYNSFYKYVIDRYNGSSTNAAIINSYIDLIYGNGLENLNGNVQDFLIFKRMLSEVELRKIISDYELFGEAAIQIIKAKGNKQPTLYHLPKENTAPKKVNEDNEIEGYFYCEDWKKAREDEIEYFPVLSENKTQTECFVIRPYKAGKKYFSDPDYLAGLPYAELEEEIANYYVSHIKNGLSFGYIINIPDGNSYTPEEKDQIELKIKRNLIGSSNAGKFIINFNARDAEITVTSIDVNDAHKQWEYLTGEARQQLLTAHRVTSPMLFGIKDNTGLGNNANELDVAEEQLMKRVIAPKQRTLIESLEQIAEFYGLVLELGFKPITKEIKTDVDSSFTGIQISSAVEVINQVNAGTLSREQGESILRSMLQFPDDEIKNLFKEGFKPSITQVKYTDVHPVQSLINLGEDIDLNEYYIAAEDELDYNEVIEFASTGTARPNAKSEQDSKDILIRYRYVDQRGRSGADGATGEREFCKQMIRANKLYRKEDIIQMEYKPVNPGFGLNGTDTYSIWLYKGGGLLSEKFPNGTCKHKWNRVIFFKKGVNVDPNSPLAEIISTSEAKRKGFKVPVNDPMVGLTPHEAKI